VAPETTSILPLNKEGMGQDSSVSGVQIYRMDRTVRYFYLRHHVQTDWGAQTSSHPMVTLNTFTRGKLAGA